MRVLKGSKGQGMTEYILIIALIAILVIGAVRMFGGKVKQGFSDAAEKVGETVDDSIAESDK
ncbi:MAG TPA: Flp family type IVb pilin [Candidatus Goldiibacteriota bacterium]|nr:Flp family type IVb pilin [Candidatus Goldiibacteriota bacterium]